MFKRLILLFPFALLIKPAKFYNFPKELEAKAEHIVSSYLRQNILIKMCLKRTHFDTKNTLTL
jgi:hypothetical protein